MLIHLDTARFQVLEQQGPEGPYVSLQLSPEVSLSTSDPDDLARLASLAEVARHQLEGLIKAHGPGEAVPVGDTGLMLQPLPVGVP